MDDKLATPAYQIKLAFLIGKPGELRLEDGFIAFTSGDRLVFRASLPEVRTSFPKVTFFAFIPFFDAGIKLTVGGNTYRLSFVPYEYSRWGSQWWFSGEDVKQGRAAVRQWRAVLGQPANEALRTRCRECGAEMAGAAQVCARCGTPVAHEPPVVDAAAGVPGAPIALPHELVGQRTGRSPRRNALIMVGAGLTALAAVIAVIAIANSSTSSHSSSTSSHSSVSSAPSAPSVSSAPSPTASPSRLAYDQLRPGDCLQVPNINTISTWPNFFTVVPCAQRHTGEVFFANDIWPQSIAYPGDNATSKQADARCGRAFTPYDGISPDRSAFTYAYDLPDSTSWPSGDRSIQCIAYDPNGASMDYSLKGSNQ